MIFGRLVSENPLRALRDKAEAMRPAGGYGFATDASMYSDAVAVAIATPQASAVLLVDKAEYKPLEVARLFGIDLKAMPVAKLPPTKRS